MKSKVSLVIAAGESVGKTFSLREGLNLVGRWDPDKGAFPEVDLEAHDPEAKVSRRHAIIEVSDNGVEIEDIGSLNGTFLNRGPRLQPNVRTPLANDDEVIIGKTFLRVMITPEG